MRRLLDRLLVALVPYTGLLTVSTCGAPADCEETGDRKTATMTANVTNDVDLQSSVDGAITDEAWRCESRVSARRDRAKDDTSLQALPATAQIFCSIEENGLTKTTWTFTVPLADLREPALAAETNVTLETNRQDHRNPSASCNAQLSEVKVATVIDASTGAAAAPPSYVTADFTRRLTTTITIDGSACGTTKGTITLSIALDASSFVEGDTPTCL